MRVSDFDYELPAELIAQHPLPGRDDSRMMVVDRTAGRIAHDEFRRLPEFLGRGDVLVLNDVKVIPAKAWGTIRGIEVEFLFVKETAPGEWDVLCRPARRVGIGDRVRFDAGFEAEVAGRMEAGHRMLRFAATDVKARLRTVGFAPLPPYIKRKKKEFRERPTDLERYQTVFAAKEGAIAAPTAGLHFTPEILARLDGQGVEAVRINLEVGLATFQPVRVERVEDHRMLEEYYEIPCCAAEAVNAAKREGRPVTAVGTTVVRALESAALAAGSERTGAETDPAPGARNLLERGRSATSLFITPGFEFRAVDRLLTNFHLPKSTLLMLVSAFAGRELILEAYREAVRERYRFFSYGDCMLIL
jgi:S-adenosylmethionine:tRNA ribosyltransferase-isomerase